MKRIIENNECFEIFTEQEPLKLCFKRKEENSEIVELYLRFTLNFEGTTHVKRLPQKRIVLFNTNTKSVTLPEHYGSIDIRIRDEARKKIYCFILKNNIIRNNKKESNDSRTIQF